MGQNEVTLATAKFIHIQEREPKSQSSFLMILDMIQKIEFAFERKSDRS